MLKNLTSVFRPRKVIEQHIAVFGESGSGKTMLLNTLYGWHQEPQFHKNKGYRLTATDTSQGHHLLNGYLKMKDSFLPVTTSFVYKSFKFDINVRGLDAPAGSLVWHDYPGEWWNETKEGTEGARKLEAIRLLLQSDVAFILCDAQRLKDDGEKYLRRLFMSFNSELVNQKKALMPDGNPLTLFPRIWIICLSKADLLPDKDVYWFRSQVIKAAKEDLEVLNETIKSMISGDSCQSIGEDFLLLSSAEFDPENGKLTNPEHHVGIDLIPPISIIVPVERALFWERAKGNSQAAVHKLTESFRSLTTNWMKYLPLVGGVFSLVDDGAKSLVTKLKEVETEARERGDSVETVIAAFRGRLEDESTKQIYLSKKL
ncbi:TRAFAC clade GTPase domain-containing protein [Nostoc sp. CCY0012]|uniref:TRAFAC clade GTPase domain-containing protein n=1 Tax=Nostoc sp. CCY0012 TaxID=1056123 RepID=UPI0039C66B63